MKFREVIKLLLSGPGKMTQAELGKRLGMKPGRAQQNVSNMTRTNDNSTVEKQWIVFLKILAICTEKGIDLKPPRVP